MTREENTWNCSECGAEQGRHDISFEGDVCGSCFDSKLTHSENVKLQNLCNTLRVEIKREVGLQNISGGFCKVDFQSCDSNTIYLLVKYGTQNDVENSITEEDIELDRDNFEVINREIRWK